jgi:uncharacterized protein YajQ (UPF0234 family)
MNMANFSFDVVSDYDKAEMNNVFDQAKKELSNRYDLKGTSANLEWLDSDKSGLLITGDNDYHIEAVTDLVRKKLAARNQSQKVLDTTKEPVVSNLKTTKEIRFKSGLKGDDAKKITKLIRDSYPKAKTQIQGEEVRVTSPKKDELQAVMDLLRKQDYDFPLNFVNFR